MFSTPHESQTPRRDTGTLQMDAILATLPPSRRKKGFCPNWAMTQPVKNCHNLVNEVPTKFISMFLFQQTLCLEHPAAGHFPL